MASSLPAASAAAPVAGKTCSSSSSSSSQRNHGNSKVSFRLSSKPKLLFAAKGRRTNWNHSVVAKAQLNEAIVDGSSNAASNPATKSEVPASDKKDVKSVTSPALASEESLSEFMTQVASLVKLVDSRDIVELQLKQLDCEVTIRKKEALPQPQAPVVMMQQPSQPAATQSHYAPAQATAPPPSAPAPSLPAAAKAPKSSLPPLKCPMAGTFYRCSGPGEPPFVKVGDQVKKGQVLCIIEAMKLMNEIEADQSGKIVEILAEDGKPVSVDMPLFVIEP